MGGTQSSGTRKLSIPNDGSIIQVSDSVVDRLTKCKEVPIRPVQEPKKEDPDACPPDENELKVRKGESPSVEEIGNSILNSYYGPSLTTLRVLQEKEEEFKESEKYWAKRIKKLEDHHSHVHRVLEQEYEKTALEMKKQLPKKQERSTASCSEGKKKVLDCYKRNPNQALLCAVEVNEFANCVHNERIS